MAKRGSEQQIDIRRRRLLKTAALGGAALGGSGFLTAKGQAQSAEASSLVPESMLVQGKPVASPPYGVPSEFEKHVVRLANDRTPTPFSSWSFTALQDLHG